MAIKAVVPSGFHQPHTYSSSLFGFFCSTICCFSFNLSVDLRVARLSPTSRSSWFLLNFNNSIPKFTSASVAKRSCRSY